MIGHPYPSYRPSGVEWLGDIPAHWEVRRIRHTCEFAYGDSLPAAIRQPGKVPVSGSNGVIGYHDEPNTLAPVIVIGRKGSHGEVNFSDASVFAIDTTYFVDERHTSADLRWLYFALQCTELADESLDSAVPGLSREHAYGKCLPVPPVAEQRAIADYLDTETARIDTLISKKRRLIELLAERWRSEVMNTIFQQSHSVRRAAIRHVVDLLPGYAFTSSEFAEEGIRLLRGLNIAPGRLRWDSDVVYVAAEDRPQYSEYELAEGDIVLGMDRPVIASGMRVASVSPSDLPCLLVQRVARIRTTKRADIRYIRFILESDAFVAYFSPISTGVSVPHISADQVLSFRAPLPSRGVQSALATQLAKKQAHFAALRDRLIAQINLLSERRQALITAAVTGEVMVSSR